MSTAAPVPTTHDLEGDDALDAVRRTGLGRLLVRSFTRFRYADGFSHARALAFQLVLALIPALITVVALARVLDQRTVTEVVADTTRSIAPGPAGRLLTQSFEQGSKSAAGDSAETALILGLAAALIAAATAMGQVERGSNRIYGVERDRPPVRKYLVATALALSAGVATALAFVLVVFGSEIGDALKSATGWSRGPDLAWTVARWPLGAALVAAAVALLFTVSPRRPQPSAAWLALGSALAVLLWFAFTGLLALYVEATRGFGETYGPLAGVIGLMLWALVSALALLFGLSVAAQLEAERAGVPGPGAEPAPADGREQARRTYVR